MGRMKSVLISVRPEWCEKIASGKKTIEVRKTRPRCETPFKCYIYETKDRSLIGVHKVPYLSSEGYGLSFAKANRGSGKVIGEFICDKISEAHWEQDIGYACVYKTWRDNEDCMTNDELLDYMGDKDILYGWHISQLKIYDEPKDIQEFHKPCNPWCEYLKECGGNCLFFLSRPPQSWCYVEEQK